MNKNKIFDNLIYLIDGPPENSHTRKLKEQMKGVLQDELERPGNEGRIYPTVLNEFVYKHFMSREAQKQGYGLEHVVDFLNWLQSEMDIAPKP
jgi:hypothetical protein